MADNEPMAHLRQLAARPDWPLVSGLALAAAAVLETVLWTGGAGNSDESLAVVLNLLATAPLIARQTHLAAVAAIVTVATLWLVLDSATLSLAAIVGQTWVLYLAAARYRGWVPVVLALPYAVNGLGPGDGEDAGLTAALMLVLAVSAVAVGASRRVQGKAIAERDAALREQAAMGERARIARELHDVVAHHISMIVVEADTARLTTPGMPEAGQERLLSIRETARGAMDEMRRLLGVFRNAADEAAHDPQPGLDRLEELIDAAREAGTHVRLIVHGRVVPLSPGVDLTAYRIVQEALTNARRHAPGAAVDVELGYTADELRLRVRDDGPGAENGNGAGGQGLLGMRERVAIVGGSLRTGPGEGGGFAVEADLPIAP
jgi:signal transduction histidine kinase